jgi:cation diffusion facilitator family transporter
MERMTDQGATLRKALALTCVILAVEFAGGVVSHSLALLSDAGHVLTDVFALGLAWFAIEQAKRPADRRRSYGYQRVSILAALVNSVILIVIVIAIAIEAVRRSPCRALSSSSPRLPPSRSMRTWCSACEFTART